MDMATGKVYFWDSITDEVAWEPPTDTQPRSKQETADTFAAHISATSGAPGTSQPAAPTSAASGVPASSAATAAADKDSQMSDAAPAGASVSSESSAEELADTSTAEFGEQIDPNHEEGEVNETSDRPAIATQATAARLAPASNDLAATALHHIASTDTPTLQVGSPLLPSADVAALGQHIAAQVQAALHRLCQGVPQLVRLAVEADIRLQDWQMFAAKQQAAVDKAQPSEALSWQDFQDHVQWRWRSIEAAMPEAVAQAEELRVSFSFA